ncbi:MAG: GNAT family N-acetyltransferase [Vicinamibacterales bacterium]
MTRPRRLTFRPLSADTWPDLVALFGPRGACGGCWCMVWRRSRRDFVAGKAGGNRRALARLARATPSPGVLAYAGREAVGWCAVAPRSAYPALERSRVLQPVDDQAVWSVSCFVVAKAWRGQGVSLALLRRAVAFAAARGARIVEGYPTETAAPAPAVFVWTGLASVFRAAGFTEVARRSPTRPIFRIDCRAGSTGSRAPGEAHGSASDAVTE